MRLSRPVLTDIVERSAQHSNGWFIEGSHPAILGDFTTGPLWWGMLQLFMGMQVAGLPQEYGGGEQALDGKEPLRSKSVP